MHVDWSAVCAIKHDEGRERNAIPVDPVPSNQSVGSGKRTASNRRLIAMGCVAILQAILMGAEYDRSFPRSRSADGTDFGWRECEGEERRPRKTDDEHKIQLMPDGDVPKAATGSGVWGMTHLWA